MTISKKDAYFQYVRKLAGLERAIDTKLNDTPVDVQNVVEPTNIEFVVWCDDVNNPKWDLMLASAKSCAEMRIDDAGYSVALLKHVDLLNEYNNNELFDKIHYFTLSGVLEIVSVNDDGLLYDVNEDYYIIIDGNVTVDGKHTIVKSFRVKDGEISMYDIYNEMHEIVGDSDVFNVAKLVDC
jgi:hypothetical protein